MTIGIYSKWAEVDRQFPFMVSDRSRLQIVWAKEVLNNPTIYAAKLSILLQFLRIFAPIHSGTAYWCIHLVIWLNTLYYVVLFPVTIFLCRPIRKAWQPWLPGRCSNVNAMIVASALINLASDLLIMVIPIFCISQLQMRTSRKIGVAAVFAMGIL